jgi:PilZ domain
VIDRQSVPWLVSMVCRKAVEQDATTDLTLDVAEIRGDDQRTADRLDVATGLTLHVVSSTSLRDADEVRGQIVNLSRDGLAFTAAEPLAAGDRLRFYARFLEGAIEGELRVASLRTIAGDRILGCWFTEVEPATRDVIDRILDRTRGETTSLSYPDLRALFHDGSQEGAFSAHIPGSGARG